MNNDIRNLQKWLNEGQETPIDRQALARVLAMAEQPAQQQEPEPDRVKFERHWRKTRGEKKANRELPRHPLQPQTYIQDSANRHWVTWQAAVRSVAPPAQRKPLRGERFVEIARAIAPRTVLGLQETIPVWIVKYGRAIEAEHNIKEQP
jgi:hypothetical protein